MASHGHCRMTFNINYNDSKTSIFFIDVKHMLKITFQLKHPQSGAKLILLGVILTMFFNFFIYQRLV